MPVKTITAEIDGKVRKIKADIPDGASQDDIMSAITEWSAANQPKPPQEGAFKRFSKALGEGNPMSMQHGTPEEMAARVGRPLTEQLSELNPINMLRGLAQPIDELARGQTAEGLGHIIGGMGAGATKPAGFRSPITVGEPIIPRPGGIVSRVVPGARQAGNIASEVSRLRLRSPLKPWEPPTTPTTPASPRFKQPPLAAASTPKPAASSPTPPLPPSRMTPNPANLRDWLRGGERPTPPIESAPKKVPKPVHEPRPVVEEPAAKPAKPAKPTKEASLESKLRESVEQAKAKKVAKKAKSEYYNEQSHQAKVKKMSNFLKSNGVDPEMANGATKAEKLDLLQQADVKDFSDLDSAWNEVIDEMQGRSSPAKGPTPDLPPSRFKP